LKSKYYPIPLKIPYKEEASESLLTEVINRLVEPNLTISTMKGTRIKARMSRLGWLQSLNSERSMTTVVEGLYRNLFCTLNL
jgi:hypothetical protein